MSSICKKDIQYGKKDLLAPDEFDSTYGKERISLLVDMQVVAAFKEKAEREGKKYQVLVHEFSHALWESLSFEKKRSYFEAMGWSQITYKGKPTWIGRDSSYVEADGVLNPSEDFSNNLEYYYINPKILKKTTPKAFDWIRKNL